MISNELKERIARILVLQSRLYENFGKPKLMDIDEYTNPLEQLDYLIEFVFINQRDFFARRKDLFDSTSLSEYTYWELEKEKEMWAETDKIYLEEIDDILMDIGSDVTEEFSIFTKSTNLEYRDYQKIDAIKKKFQRYRNTREHNLKGIFVKLATNIQEVINNISLVVSPGEEDNINKPIYDIDKIIEQVIEILKEVFSGRNRVNLRIMTKEDYERLVKYTIAMIKDDKLPVIVTKIPQIYLTDQFILTTYRRIYDLLGKDKERRKLFGTFIFNCFQQFKNVSFSEDDYMNSVIYKKFTRPDNTYLKDLKGFSH
jgi:hypothetical protein